MESPPIIEEDVTINTKQNKKQFVTCGKGGAIKFWNFNNQLLSFSKKNLVFYRLQPMMIISDIYLSILFF